MNCISPLFRWQWNHSCMSKKIIFHLHRTGKWHQTIIKQLEEKNYNNWCHYAKTKTGLSAHSLCLDHVIRQNVSKWSCIGPPNSQKQPKKGTGVKPTSTYDPPYVPLYYIEGFLMLYSMFNFCQNPEGGFDVKLVNSSFIWTWYIIPAFNRIIQLVIHTH